MSAQLVFFIAAIVAFVIAAVFIGLSIYTFVNQDILSVRDDLSGKRRQRELEDGESSRKARSKRSRIGNKTPDSVGVPDKGGVDAAGGKRGGKRASSKSNSRNQGREFVGAAPEKMPKAQVVADRGASQPDDEVTSVLDGEGDDRTVVLAGKQRDVRRGSAESQVSPHRENAVEADRNTLETTEDKNRIDSRIAFKVTRKEVHVDTGASVIR